MPALSRSLAHFQVLQLNDKNFENKIHQTFRLNYLKDSAFGRIFEDMPPLSVLAGMVHANCVQLVTQFFTSDLMKTLYVLFPRMFRLVFLLFLIC